MSCFFSILTFQQNDLKIGTFDIVLCFLPSIKHRTIIEQISSHKSEIEDYSKNLKSLIQVPEVAKNNKTKGKKTNVNKPVKPKAKSEAALARDEARYVILGITQKF